MMQKCSPIFKDRMKYIGNYNSHECKIELFNVTKADEGTWNCKMESYVLGLTRGNIAESKVEFYEVQ